ncbi:MAG: AraC family transcriptional regulator [Arcobacter sp.]|nr:MAG: AraC family transcriptional regulator [Arcobacter sp.]
MIITLPNYLYENPKSFTLISDKTFIASKSIHYNKGKLSLRNSRHMIVLLINGEKVLHLKDKDIKIDESEILYLAQSNYFMTEKISKRNDYESILICFDDDFILNFLKKYNIKLETKESETIIAVKKDAFLSSCVTSINTLFNSKLENKIDLLKLKTEELFLYTLSQDKQQFISFFNSIVSTESSRVKHILESNLDIITCVLDMCKLTRLSKKALRKEIQRLYNQNPKKWLDTNRLYIASLLLRQTKNSISNIATSCGYSSVSWFIIQFKKYYKTTPFLYREENL